MDDTTDNPDLAYWQTLEVERLARLARIAADQAVIADELRRAELRHLSERYARETWCGNLDAAALLQDRIDRLERGAP